MEHTGFPSDETLAAFLDGRLDPDTRRRVIEHMTTCNECYAVVASGGTADLALRPYVPKTRAALLPGPTSWKVAIAACLAAGLIGLAAFRYPWRPVSKTPGASSIARLVEAVPSRRTLEARLSGFPYRRLGVNRGGESMFEDTERLRLLGVAAPIIEKGKTIPSRENLHAAGVAELLIGQTKAAAETLLKALRPTPGVDLNRAIDQEADLSLLVDLSSALYARGLDGDENSFSLSLSATNRVLKRQPQNAEAAFNRALVLEKLEFRSDAIAAWRRYLALEAATPWRLEARTHLARLTENSARPSWPNARSAIASALRNSDVALMRLLAVAEQGSAQKYCEEVLLPGLNLDTAHEAIAPTDEQFLLIVAEANRDPLLTEILDDGLKRHDLNSLKRALKAYGRGVAAIQDNHVLNAISSFRAANHCLAGSSSPLRRLVLLRLASSLFAANRYGDAKEAAQAAVTGARGAYHTLDARAQWLIGLCDLALKQPYDALRSYSMARSEYEYLSDEDGQAVIASLLAEAYEYIGDRGAAAVTRRIALSRSLYLSDPKRSAGIVAEAARTAERHRDDAVANVATSRLLQIARSTRDPEVITDAYVLAAGALVNAGDFVQARNALAAAQRAAREITDPQVFARASAGISLANASAAATPTEALAAIDSTVSFFSRSDNAFGISEALLTRAKILDAVGQTQPARRDLMRALEVGLEEQQRVHDGVLRATNWERQQAVLRSLIDDAFGNGDSNGALYYAELARLDPGAGMPPQISKERFAKSVISAMSRKDAVLAYVSTYKHVFGWVVTVDGVVGRELDLSPEQLDLALADVLLTLRQDRRMTSRAQLQRLYRCLVGPFAPHLRGRSRVLIAAAGSFWGIPFNTLIDGNGKYLIESFRIAKLPSLSKLGASPDQPQHDGRLSVVVLLEDHGSGEHASLPRAAAEAAAVTKLYERATLLRGSRTLEELRDAFGAADVIHIASHSHATRESPLAAGLILGERQGGEYELLYAHDIAVMRLSRHPLVVVNACSTAASSDEHPGSSSIAAAFLKAGAGAVVGTLWDIDDDVASELSVALHRGIRAGERAEDALRSIQLNCINSSDTVRRQPGYWGVMDLVTVG